MQQAEKSLKQALKNIHWISHEISQLEGYPVKPVSEKWWGQTLDCSGLKSELEEVVDYFYQRFRGIK